MGEGTEATGTAAHSQGMFTDATGTTAHAQGHNTKALSNYAHSEGYGSIANNTAAQPKVEHLGFRLFSHASNRNTVASATCAHAVKARKPPPTPPPRGLLHCGLRFRGHAEGY